MENTQSKSKQLFKPISYYHKYNCETCNYHTNFKNSYNKHTKSTKHLTLVPKNEEDQNECEPSVVKDQQQIDRKIISEELPSDVVMDASMGFITVEEIQKDTKNEDELSYNDYQLSKIVDLMESLNMSVKNDLRVKYFYTGMGFFFNFILFNLFLFHLFIRGQRSDFFELSG